MILAAGRGERLRPLTDTVPKVLLDVSGQPLIAHHLLALAKAGIEKVVINVAHLAKRIEETLGNGDRYGVTIQYSHEPAGALDTGGGIRHALALLPDPFLVVNGDILTDFDFRQLCTSEKLLAHLVMVTNPPHNRTGDFFFSDNRLLPSPTPNSQRMTYSGIGLYHHALFGLTNDVRFSLATLLHKAVAKQQIGATVHRGNWIDVGTHERLAEARALTAVMRREEG